MVSSREPGALLTLSLSRMGQPVTETVAIGAEPAEGGASENGGGAVNVGLILQTIRGAGAEVLAADPGTAAGRAGLRAGDLVVRLGDKRAPEAGDILKAYAAARAGDALLLTVRRGTQHLVLALEKP
jgi:S1-C subfamily serine protease